MGGAAALGSHWEAACPGDPGARRTDCPPFTGALSTVSPARPLCTEGGGSLKCKVEIEDRRHGKDVLISQPI